VDVSQKGIRARTFLEGAMMGSRIKLDMTTIDVLTTMSEGNPGALVVLMKLLKETERVDPLSALGGLGTIMWMDTLDIYGPRIWMLYKDVCGENIEKTVLMLRACQLGFIYQEELDRRIDNYGKEGVDEIVAKVKERLGYPTENQGESETVDQHLA